MATPFDPQPAELYTQPVQVQSTLSNLTVLLAFSQQRMADLKAVHDPLVQQGAGPLVDEAAVEALGKAILKEEGLERAITDYRNDVVRWAVNDQSYWACKMLRPPFPDAPAIIPASADLLPPLPHIQNPAYFIGLRDGVKLFVPSDLKSAAFAAIDKLEKSS